jgi:polar amino acid transport system substrate-binding protein
MSRIVTEHRKSWAIVLVILAVALAPSFVWAQTSTLKLIGSLWSPYVDPNRPNGGLASELVSSALRKAGYEVEASLETWPRAYRGAAVGIYDVVVAVWRTPAREQELLFSEPYLMNEIIFLGRAGGNVRFERLEDLVGKKIGIVRDYAYGGGFDDHPRLNRVVNNHLVQNLLLLREGKLDLVVDDQWAIMYQLSYFMPSAMAHFEVLPRPLIRRGLRIGVSRQNPQHEKIVADFDQAMRQMDEDGTYEQILDKHTAGIATIAPGR